MFSIGLLLRWALPDTYGSAIRIALRVGQLLNSFWRLHIRTATPPVRDMYSENYKVKRLTPNFSTAHGRGLC